MTTITIRDVPDEVRDVLAARAKRDGKSMQEYLRRTLIDLSQRTDPAEFWDRVRARVEGSGVTFSVDEVRAARDEGRP